MIKIVVNAKAEELKPYMNELIWERIKAGRTEQFESLENACIISFDWYDIFDRTLEPLQIIIFYSIEHLFFICEEDRLLKKVTAIVKEFPEMERVLASFFSELMKPDMDYLEELEDEIAELEDSLIINTKTQCAHDIVRFRKELIRLKKYYEQLNSIFEDITANESKLISHAGLRYFVILDNRVDRLFSTVLNLRDYVTQVREAYQAQIDIEQNNIMKAFTVITSIFLPLTLLVGWYGMNLRMPEFEWDFGYPMVIILSIVVCILSIAIFKIKKWF